MMFTPFDPDQDKDYLIWRDKKLHNYPRSLDELIVEVYDPMSLSRAEYDALHACCRKTNMVIYASAARGENKDLPRRVGEQFGLLNLNHNWLADEDAITSLTVNDEGDHPVYIPYTNRPIKWHTDGYYNRPGEQIHGLLLHCVRPARKGGDNQLMDHEIAYILLRDKNPDYIRALMQDDAMTIPARLDEKGEVERAAESGPVFSVAADGHLHMRYTARTRSIEWKDDERVKAAVAELKKILQEDSPYKYRGTLQPGMGLISNNVLHDRSGFEDDEATPRLLYRARYYDRIAGTDL